MSVTSPSATPSPEDRTRLSLLVDEATRQLDVCNACRYCEGLCAVFPALSRRTVLSAGDVSQLANLCHDCRACFDACMYTAPHEFHLNVPAVLTEVRLEDYQRYVWPARVPGLLRGWTGLFAGAVASACLLTGIAAANAGWSAIVAAHDTPASPYRLIPDGVLVGLMLAAVAYSLSVGALAARSYWVATGGGDVKVRPADVLRATWYALTLRYLRGGGVDCYYPQDDKPSPVRRYLHLLTVAGFGLCIASTVAAAVLQDLLGDQPPYAWLSAPVIAGTVGGVGLLAGCTGLLLLKARSSRVTGIAQMTVKDYGLLTALTFLALSGLAVLLTRNTAAFGIILLIHLAAVTLSFASAPYSKFVHVVFRFAALIRDNAEQLPAGAAHRLGFRRVDLSCIPGKDTAMTTWLITGCSTGLGRALAEAAAEAGHNVVATARDQAKVADLAAGNDHVLALALDVTDPAQVTSAVTEAERAFGGVDVLVNNAGYGYRAAVEEGDEADIRTLFETHFFGSVGLIKAVLPGMRSRRSGVIVNISSIGATRTPVGSGYYAAAKAAIEGMTGSLRGELEPLGISAMAVEPGGFATDFAGRSLTQSRTVIEDYAGTAGKRRKENVVTTRAKGDPVKAAQAIMRAVAAGHPPALLLLGSDAVDTYREVLQRRLDEAREWEPLSRSTDFDA
jgi:CitB-like protein